MRTGSPTSTGSSDSRTAVRSPCRAGRRPPYAPLVQALARTSPSAPAHRRLRDAAITAWLPLAYRMAGRYGQVPATREDLRQVAAVALIHAVDRFAPGTGVPFPRYAARVIRGELQHYLRDTGWTVRPPRRLQELAVRAGRAAPELSQRLGHWPGTAELADALHVDRADLAAALVAGQARRSVPLDHAGATTDARLDAVVERAGLRAALHTLEPRHRYVLCATFVDGRTQHQIAADLHTTQPNVCRLRKQALSLLYDQLGPA
jgi:RNA polymerase sigma-B factor